MSMTCEINCFPVKLVKATFYWVVGCTNKALAAFESMLFCFLVSIFEECGLLNFIGAIPHHGITTQKVIGIIVLVILRKS